VARIANRALIHTDACTRVCVLIGVASALFYFALTLPYPAFARYSTICRIAVFARRYSFHECK